MSSSVVVLTHDSQLLKGNAMGDPHVRKLPVFLPPSYDAHRSEPYPVVYLLSGWSGRGARYLNDEGVFVQSLPDRLSQMMSSGQMRSAIVVFPDCGTKLGASQYVNSTANGPYMDYLCDELIPYIDERFNTARDPRFRGITGHSSGGFGALATVMIRPDRFSSVLSSAGDTWYEYLYAATIPEMIRTLGKAGGVQAFIEKFLSSPNPMGLLSPDDGLTMMNLSMCACYAPNLSVPLLKGDVYFDLHTGELIPSVWEKFLSWDPVHMVDRHASALKQMKWIRLEAGTDDEYGLHIGHRRFAKKLDAQRIKYEIEEYPGKHGGHHYRYGERLRRMLDQMYT